MEAKAWYWYSHPTDGFVPAQLKSLTPEGGYIIRTSTNEQFNVDEPLPRAHESSLQIHENMVAMQELSEPAILHNLRQCFEKDAIYTYISSILISVNPFKQLPIYSSHVMGEYRTALAARQPMPPHVYALADNAYRSLTSQYRNQAVVISGESGAGKTEATKLVLQYLAEMSGQGSDVEQQVLEANPIMEAFGNAKTVRNNNSSRFGKWVEVCFDSKFHIAGAKIDSYLLEKSRIVDQAPGERNYHIFYQLLAGLDERQKSQYGLTNAMDFAILRNGANGVGPSALRAGEMDDVEEFQRTCRSFSVLNIPNDQREEIFRITAGLMHLGNVQFIAKGDASSIANPDALDRAAALLRVDKATLSNALTNQRKQMGRDFVVTNKTKTQAEAGLQAAVKAVYSAQFDWIISAVNKTLNPPTKSQYFVGVLDIFGFEIFHTNYFEQLCINFTNEKMQSHFNQHIFKLELEEYSAEKLDIDVSSVSYIDNQPCLDLIEKGRMSIFSMCDDEIRTPKGNDETLLEKMNTTFASNQFYARPKMKTPTFTVNHYAGPVEYTIDGFLMKNKDGLEADIASTMISSSSPILSQIMQTAANAQLSNATISSTFKTQLNTLMAALHSCDPHFIRCIKSNNNKLKDTFDGDLVLRQLRYLGLREVVLIRQRGFPVRRSHKEFVARYRMLIDKPSPTPRDILSHFDPDNSNWKLGTTKVFYRIEVQTALEKARDKSMSALVIQLQSTFRCTLERKRFLRRKQASDSLRIAVEKGDLKLLESAIEIAESVGLVDPSLLRQAVVARNKLVEQADAMRALKTANVSYDIEILKVAIRTAQQANIQSSTNPEHREALQKAENMVRMLGLFTELSDRAFKTRDLDATRQAHSMAKQIGLPPNTISRLEALLKAVSEENEMQTSLSNAMVQQDISALRRALQIAIDNKSGAMIRTLLERAKELRMNGDPIYEAAVTLEVSLDKEITAFSMAKELKAAIDSNNLLVLRATVKTAISKGFGAHNLVEQSNARIVVLEEIETVKVSLMEAVKSNNRVAIEKAIESAKRLGVDQGEEMEVAKKALENLVGKQRKFKAAARNSIIATTGYAEAKAAAAALAEANSMGFGDAPPPPPPTRFTKAQLAELQNALDDAIAAGLEDEVSDLTERLKHAQATEKAYDSLDAAIQAESEEMLDNAIERARNAGIEDGDPNLEDALDLRLRLADKKAMRVQQLASTNRRSMAEASKSAGKDGIPTYLRCTTIEEATIHAMNMTQRSSYTGDKTFSILANFSGIRSTVDFVKSKWFGKDKLKLGMMRHTTGDLPTSMVDFEFFNCRTLLYEEREGGSGMSSPTSSGQRNLGIVSTSQHQKDISRAMSIFKSIQAYMLDRRLSFPESLIAEAVQTAQVNEQFRDELYVQVMKQLTENTNAVGMLVGWRLLAIFIQHFSPSPSFLSYLMYFLYIHSHGASSENRARIATKLTEDQAESIKDIATHCLAVLPQTLAACLLESSLKLAKTKAYAEDTHGRSEKNDLGLYGGVLVQNEPGKTASLINLISSFAVKNMSPGTVQIHFPDQSGILVHVNPWDTIDAVINKACAICGIDDKTGLSLYEKVGQGFTAKYYALLPHETPLDLIMTWIDRKKFLEHKKKTGIVTDPKKERTIVIRRRLFVQPILVSACRYMNVLLFHQTREDVDAGLHHLHTDSAAMLASMVTSLLTLLSPLAPPPPPDADVKYPATPNLLSFMPTCPPNLLVGKGKTTAKKFAALVQSFDNQIDKSVLSVEQYVATAMQLPTFCASFFHCTQSYDKDVPTKVILAVNQTGFFVLDATTRAAIESYPLISVLGWSSAPQRLVIQVRLPKPDRQGKTVKVLRFSPEEDRSGQEVCELLMEYASEMLKRLKMSK